MKSTANRPEPVEPAFISLAASPEPFIWIMPLSRGLHLRPALDTDADRIMRLISEIWSECPDQRSRAQDDMPGLLSPVGHYTASGGLLWVLEKSDEIVGTVAIKPAAEPQVAELQHLYVHRSWRRRGLGAFLCEVVEQEALVRQCSAVELWSDVWLVDAPRLFERRGYIRAEETTNADCCSTVRCCYRKQLTRTP